MSKGYRFVKLFGMWLRIVFSAISLMACATFLLWHFDRPMIVGLGKYVINTYEYYHRKNYNHVITVASKNPQEGIVVLGQFLDDFAGIYKADRLDPLKRSAYEKLITLLSNADRNEEALVWAEEWAKFDDRDLFAQVWRAKLMRKIPSKFDDGWLLISELSKKFLYSDRVMDEYVEYLIERGRFADAFVGLYKAIGKQDSLMGRPWQIYWDMGDGYKAKQMMNVSPTIDVGGRMSFRIDVPLGIVGLRIDPPSNTRINIIDPVLSAGDKANKFSLIAAIQGLNQISKYDNILVTSGGDDPYFWWKWPSSLESEKEIFFVCTFEEKMPEVMGEIIEKSDHDAVAKELQERKEFDALRQFRRLVTQKNGSGKTFTRFDKAFFELFWSESGKNFSEQRKLRKDMGGSVKDGALEFDIVFDVDSLIDNIRIDFPGVVGAKFLFKAIELVGDGWSQQIDATKTGVARSHNVVQLGTGFVVRGDDPYIVFPPLPEARVAQSVIIRGAAF